MQSFEQSLRLRELSGQSVIILICQFDSILGDSLIRGSQGNRVVVSQLGSVCFQIENIRTSLAFVESLGVALEGICAKDVRDGNLKAILGLFFALSRHKQQQKQRAAERDRLGKLAPTAVATPPPAPANAAAATPPPPHAAADMTRSVQQRHASLNNPAQSNNPKLIFRRGSIGEFFRYQFRYRYPSIARKSVLLTRVSSVYHILYAFHIQRFEISVLWIPGKRTEFRIAFLEMSRNVI